MAKSILAARCTVAGIIEGFDREMKKVEYWVKESLNMKMHL